MRDLLYKNLTSVDKKRKKISSSETLDKEGMRSIIHRHFICLVKEINNYKEKQPAPYACVLREYKNKEQSGRFFCKIKGSVYVVNCGRLYLILYLHSLRINLVHIAQNSPLI